MLEKLAHIEERYETLTQELSDPELLANPSAYAKSAKQLRTLGEIVDKYRYSQSLKQELAGTRELLETVDDDEMRELARAEASALEEKMQTAEAELRLLLIPTDPKDEKNVIVEIRAGTGGDEASLFANEILRMYGRYAEKQGWRFEILAASESGIGGIKEATALIEGDKVYSKLKHESGVHRVQRVPQTEASGRIHTSAITVAVLPEAEEVDVKIDAKDLRIDVLPVRPGGRSGTHYSAVRITHLPTNVVVSMQDESRRSESESDARVVARLQELEEQNSTKRWPASGDRWWVPGSIRRFAPTTSKENRVSTPHQPDDPSAGRV